MSREVISSLTIRYFESVGRRRNDNIGGVDWLDMSNETHWNTPEAVASFANIQKENYNISGMNVLPYWYNCPMHAESYGRTRRAHLEFARHFVQLFEELLKDRPRNFEEFQRLIEMRLLEKRT